MQKKAGMTAAKGVVFLCVALGLLLCALIAVTLIKSAPKGENEYDLLRGDPVLPAGTSVIVHTTTYTDPYALLPPPPRTCVVYYDEQGNMLGSFELADEVWDDSIVETEDGIVFFFNNYTLHADYESYSVFPNDSDITIKNRNGPMQAEYISEKNTSYAWYNVGANEERGYYATVLRFFSKSGGKNYDIVVPYCLNGVAYDSELGRFICKLDVSDRPENAFVYNTVSYDESSGMFVRDEQENVFVCDVPGFIERDLKNCWVIQAHGGKLYVLSEIAGGPHKERPGNEIEPTPRLETALGMYVFELDAQEMRVEEVKPIYPVSKRNQMGFFVGSQAFPMHVDGDMLYAFAADGEVLKLKAGTVVEAFDMPYDFYGSLNRFDPQNPVYENKGDFFGSIVSVEDDGEIYALHVYADGEVTISRLKDSQWQLHWSGVIPKQALDGMTINTFEMIDS